MRELCLNMKKGGLTMYYCGIDIGKYHHEGSVIDESGKALLDSLSFRVH